MDDFIRDYKTGMKGLFSGAVINWVMFNLVKTAGLFHPRMKIGFLNENNIQQQKRKLHLRLEK